MNQDRTQELKINVFVLSDILRLVCNYQFRNIQRQKITALSLEKGLQRGKHQSSTWKLKDSRETENKLTLHKRQTSCNKRLLPAA